MSGNNKDDQRIGHWKDMMLHQDGIFWNQFHALLTIVALLLTLQGAVFLFLIENLNSDNEDLKTSLTAIIISSAIILIIITIIWASMMMRINVYVREYRERIKIHQKEIEIIITKPKFPFYAIFGTKNGFRFFIILIIVVQVILLLIAVNAEKLL